MFLNHLLSNDLRISFFLWFCLGLPLLVRKSFQLHPETFVEDGGNDVEIMLLRTGVSNEPNIAAWISSRHGGKQVNMLSANERAGAKWSSFFYLATMFHTYFKLTGGLSHAIRRLYSTGELKEDHRRVLPPAWLVLVARTAPLMCLNRCWAELFLQKRKITHLYFTMNSMLEGSFMDALPGLSHAYVEHGFPRRDIPPLPCKQFVYGERYAEYLRSFDPDLEIEQIGTAYFPKADIGTKQRAIVVASLQDWPQWGINNVAKNFNAALSLAQEKGWKIIFRGRNYDEDSFAQGLVCEWDEISSPKEESFAECLERVKPAMVWTTWSTAVLDAMAMGIKGVCFVDDQLEDYFIPDFYEQTMVVQSDTVDLSEILQASCCSD